MKEKQMKEQATWHEGDSAWTILEGKHHFNELILREVTLSGRLHGNVWHVSWDDIAEDAEISNMHSAVPAYKLFKTEEEALQAAADAYIADLLKENREWQQELAEENE